MATVLDLFFATFFSGVKKGPEDGDLNKKSSLHTARSV
jgi:hypothetical protein